MKSLLLKKLGNPSKKGKPRTLLRQLTFDFTKHIGKVDQEEG